MLNIVCVDDNYLFLTSLAAQLKNRGYSPIFATNPKTALLELSNASRKSNPIHVVITDFHMAGYYNAVELCRKVISEFPSTFIAVLTADSDVQLKNFGGNKPDILLNKSGNYQELLFNNLDKLETELAANSIS